MSRRLRYGEKWAGLSALALFGFLFMDWFGAALPEGALSLNSSTVYSYRHVDWSGWHAAGWLTLALCVAAIILGLALPFAFATRESPVLPQLLAVVAAMVGILAVVAILVENLTQPDGAVVLSGWWLSLLAAGGVARGGYLSMHDEYLQGVPLADVPVRPAPVA